MDRDVTLISLKPAMAMPDAAVGRAPGGGESEFAARMQPVDLLSSAGRPAMTSPQSQARERPTVSAGGSAVETEDADLSDEVEDLAGDMSGDVDLDTMVEDVKGAVLQGEGLPDDNLVDADLPAAAPPQAVWSSPEDERVQEPSEGHSATDLVDIAPDQSDAMVLTAPMVFQGGVALAESAALHEPIFTRDRPSGGPAVKHITELAGPAIPAPTRMQADGTRVTALTGDAMVAQHDQRAEADPILRLDGAGRTIAPSNWPSGPSSNLAAVPSLGIFATDLAQLAVRATAAVPVPMGGADLSDGSDEALPALPALMSAGLRGAEPVHHASVPASASPGFAVRQQVAYAVLRMQGDRAEIALSPEELGSVRLVITRGEAGPLLTVWIDRAEVLDMMRGQRDALLQDLHDAGLAGGSLEFRDGATWAGDDRRDSRDGNGEAEGQQIGVATGMSGLSGARRLLPVAVGLDGPRLDIRV